MDYLSFLLCLVMAFVAMQFLRSKVGKGKELNPRRLPPGPSPLPIVGSLFSLGSKPHVSLTELAKTYGPLMILQLGWVPTVIISSPAVAKEALQKNDISFSNRTVLDAACALDHHQNSIVLLPAASRWRNFRKICNSYVFSTGRLEASQTLRRNKVKDLLSHVEKCSRDGVAVDVGQLAFVTTLNLLSNTFFSVDLADLSSESARQFKEIVRGLLEEAGKPNVADYFPLLRKMDPQGIKQRVGVHFQSMIDIFNSMIDQRLQGTRPSTLLQANDVLDALLDISHDKTEDIEQSHIPHILLVPATNRSCRT